MVRPRKAIKRQEKLTLYYTKAEFKLIEKYAERHGISKAEFARHKSLNHKLKTRMTLDEMNIYIKLVGMANNLNQVTKSVNQGEVFTTKILKTMNRSIFLLKG